MKRVELYGRVRHAVLIEGMSRREAARVFGIDTRTVAKSDDLAGLGPRINHALVKEARNDPGFRERLLQTYSRVMLLKQRLQISGE